MKNELSSEKTKKECIKDKPDDLKPRALTWTKKAQVEKVKKIAERLNPTALNQSQ